MRNLAKPFFDLFFNKKFSILILNICLILSFAACGSDSDGDDGWSAEYAIGDTGPGGGIIFYIKSDNSGGWHYLEGGRDTITSKAWASSGFYNTAITGTETAIGTGKANTDRILTTDPGAPAALAAKNYRVTGFEGVDGWFLPSQDELNELYKAKSHFGITSDYYWSSSEYSNDHAWAQYFGSSGYQFYHGKANPLSVRAIRAF